MSLRERLERVVWPRRGVPGAIGQTALRPLSGLFGAGVRLRNLAYDTGLLRAQRAEVPVVSVGNLAVGGTGKTPVTLWLSRALLDRGLAVAILLRGYGGAAANATVVSRGNGPEAGTTEVGDEAVMLAKCFTGPVVTARRRIVGATAAIQLGADVIVLDDGFQHRALARDFDLVLVDGRRGPLLPAGPLRERVSALARAHAVILVDEAERATLSSLSADVPMHAARVEPTALVESVAGRWVTHPMGMLGGKRVIAVAGIARPERFYQALQQWEAILAEVFEFRDHHQYTAADWHAIARRGHDADLIVTTEKDLVKLEAFPFESGKLMALRIAPVIERGEQLIDAILKKVGSGQRAVGSDESGQSAVGSGQ